MAKHKSTETIGRCTIQERSIEIDGQGKKRWIVTWKANDDARPVQIVCGTHSAAYALTETLNNPNVFWPY